MAAPTAAPRMTPRQIDEARTAAAQALAAAATPRPAPALPPDHRDRRSLRDRPGPRGLSRPDRASRRAVLGPHQARPGTGLGRGRPQPPRHAPARGDRRPCRRGPISRPHPRGAPDRRHAHDPGRPGPSHPGAHRGHAPRRFCQNDRSQPPDSIWSGTIPPKRSRDRTAALRILIRRAGDHRAAPGRSGIP